MVQRLLQSLTGALVVYVRSIQQCNEHVDIEQGTHGLHALAVAQLVDQLVAYHHTTRGKRHETSSAGRAHRCSSGYLPHLPC